LFFGAAVTVNMVAPMASTRVLEMFGGGLRHIGDGAGSPDAAIALLQVTGRNLIIVIGMLCGGLALASLSAGALQARGVFAMKPIAPDFGRINPIANAKR